MARKSVVIVGAGLGGICAGIHLKRAGFEDFTILEKDIQPGGTWRDNTYPGCSCDVPIAMYQFSFAPSVHWRHVFPLAAEVKQYADMMMSNFGLTPHYKGGDGARTATWDESTSRWTVQTDSGAQYEADALIVALGQLNRPKLPDIPGRNSFAGPAFHSARWNHDVSLEGKRVGVIGSAASAVQLIPQVAKAASHLTVFQRTPNWVIPRRDEVITEEDVALLLTAPHIAELTARLYYETRDYLTWQAFSWTEVGRAALTRMALNHLENQIPDPALRAKLTPQYPIGCKRILLTDDFYPSLLRSNVELETGAISAIKPQGVSMSDGRQHDFDVLVFATGFETTEWHWSLDVTGRGGQHLQQVWKDSAQAYLGITVSGFPNLFMLYGPNTNIGHNSITFMIERQTEYILQALETMQARGLSSIEVSREAQDRFNEMQQRELAKTVWADPQCQSWYKNAAGHITQNWHSHTRDYAAATKAINFEDYILRTVAIASGSSAATS